MIGLSRRMALLLLGSRDPGSPLSKLQSHLLELIWRRAYPPMPWLWQNTGRQPGSYDLRTGLPYRARRYGTIRRRLRGRHREKLRAAELYARQLWELVVRSDRPAGGMRDRLDERATLERVRQLVGLGAAVNYANPAYGGRTPLFWSVKRGQYRLALCLVESGADASLEPKPKAGASKQCRDKPLIEQMLRLKPPEEQEHWAYQRLSLLIAQQAARPLRWEFSRPAEAVSVLTVPVALLPF